MLHYILYSLVPKRHASLTGVTDCMLIWACTEYNKAVRAMQMVGSASDTIYVILFMYVWHPEIASCERCCKQSHSTVAFMSEGTLTAEILPKQPSSFSGSAKLTLKHLFLATYVSDWSACATRRSVDIQICKCLLTQMVFILTSFTRWFNAISCMKECACNMLSCDGVFSMTVKPVLAAVSKPYYILAAAEP